MAAPLITLDDIKAHLRIDFPDDDDQLTAKVATATTHIENWLGFAIADRYAEPPAPILEAIRLFAGHLYEHREAVIVDSQAQLLPEFAALINSYREWSF